MDGLPAAFDPLGGFLATSGFAVVSGSAVVSGLAGEGATAPPDTYPAAALGGAVYGTPEFAAAGGMVGVGYGIGAAPKVGPVDGTAGAAGGEAASPGAAGGGADGVDEADSGRRSPGGPLDTGGVITGGVIAGAGAGGDAPVDGSENEVTGPTVGLVPTPSVGSAPDGAEDAEGVEAEPDGTEKEVIGPVIERPSPPGRVAWGAMMGTSRSTSISGRCLGR